MTFSDEYEEQTASVTHLLSSVHFKFVDRTSWREIGKRCSITNKRVQFPFSMKRIIYTFFHL